MAEHAAIDRKQVVADLVAVRLPARHRRPHRGFAQILKRLDAGGVGQEIRRHVAAAAERRLEFLEHQEHFAVVTAGLLFRLDVNRADLSAILPIGEVGAGHEMRVIEPQSGRPRHKTDPARAMSGNVRRALLRGAVDIHRHGLPVPMQLLRRVGIVPDIDHHLPAFLQAQQRTGKLPVIEFCRHDMVGRQLDQPVGDANGVIGAALRRCDSSRSGRHLGHALGLGRSRDRSGQSCRGAEMQKFASVDCHACCSKTDAIGEIADMVSVVEAGAMLCRFRPQESPEIIGGK